MRKKNNIKYLGGFTIVELLIASAVFSTVLLVALTGFLQIGRIFYKGVSSTQTQDVTRQVVNDISSNIKIASSTGAVNTLNLNPGTGGYGWICVGTYRYTYGFYKNSSAAAPNQPIFYNAGAATQDYDPGSATASFGLLKDKMPGEGVCPAPCVANGTPTSFGKCPAPPASSLPLDTNNPTEMLANGMRIGNISLSIPNPVSAPDLYNLSVVIAYGEDSVLGYTTTGVPVPFCTGNSQSQKFCAVDQLSTTVFRGELHP